MSFLACLASLFSPPIFDPQVVPLRDPGITGPAGRVRRETYVIGLHIYSFEFHPASAQIIELGAVAVLFKILKIKLTSPTLNEALT